MVVGVGAGVLQLFVGLVLAIASIYIGLSMFGKFTKGLDEMEELKKGNVAVGILQVAIIISLANVIQTGVSGMTAALWASAYSLESIVFALIAGVIQLLVGILLAIFAIYLALKVLDWITKGIDEIEELRKGNVAVAILMAGVLFAVSLLVQAGVSGIANAIGVAIPAGGGFI
ncbi:MAG: DUF350 domain-containing protein [Candidatus Altiarchaeota archaeon]|nr:DUF350 domain-containing protein [Candidatus Altiarchaeota archaeon]